MTLIFSLLFSFKAYSCDDQVKVCLITCQQVEQMETGTIVNGDCICGFKKDLSKLLVKVPKIGWVYKDYYGR